MRQLKSFIKSRLLRLEIRWQALRLKQQQRYMMYLFGGYLVLTAMVVGQVWLNAGKPNQPAAVGRIVNPVLESREHTSSSVDSIFIKKKIKMYERN